MTHYAYAEWQKYVRNELGSTKREELETHLYTCDQCLGYYLQAIAENESSLPALSNESSFTDLVMAAVTKQPEVSDTQNNAGNLEIVPDTKIQKKPFYQRVSFHYLLAVAATLFLMFTGAFHTLTKYANVMDTHRVQEGKPSVTEGVMNKTFAWMDALEKKEAIKK
ncbi:hypothetical protein [Neobacillus mesonae]|uniref:hypothetical protein n=1 Tax=Neobacillus mesonae TaxID=1193713 RepID=UPI002040EC1F|nr:hypothetical protein [Neobacillus mesonae]MCM3570460.1 hypothetical protein [Neobacillus mesonae]